jgi:hypothetical protein
LIAIGVCQVPRELERIGSRVNGSL